MTLWRCGTWRRARVRWVSLAGEEVGRWRSRVAGFGALRRGFCEGVLERFSMCRFSFWHLCLRDGGFAMHGGCVGSMRHHRKASNALSPYEQVTFFARWLQVVHNSCQ
jgi:hypothetical protein